jgi:uncharacterized protein YjbI with pentapeptide repeats
MADLREGAAVANPELIIAIVVIAAAASAVFAFGIWWLWWRLPKRQVDRLALKIRDPKARADVEDNFRKTVGQFLGGAAVLMGAGFAVYQFWVQQKAAHDLLISNQVSKGFEQLASDKTAMRLGGIYALENVMNDKASLEQYHRPVLEALCAFVRENTKTASKDKPAIDVQAALTVIGRRINGPGTVDLANVSIHLAILSEANLSGASLGGADLSYAILSEANLSGAYLSRADLSYASLNQANLSGAKLSRIHLSGADLIQTNLTRADLSGADLTHATLISATLTSADLEGANLVDANLSGASLGGAYLGGAELRGADLSGADLRVDPRVGGLTQTQLDEACVDANTKLPDGLTPPKPCQAMPR